MPLYLQAKSQFKAIYNQYRNGIVFCYVMFVHTQGMGTNFHFILWGSSMNILNWRVVRQTSLVAVLVVAITSCAEKKMDQSKVEEAKSLMADSIGGGGPTMLNYTTIQVAQSGTDSTIRYVNSKTKGNSTFSLKTYVITGTVISDSVSGGYIKTGTPISIGTFSPSWSIGTNGNNGLQPTAGIADQPVRVTTTVQTPVLPPK